jgi:hypothetical protein
LVTLRLGILLFIIKNHDHQEPSHREKDGEHTQEQEPPVQETLSTPALGQDVSGQDQVAPEAHVPVHGEYENDAVEERASPSHNGPYGKHEH